MSADKRAESPVERDRAFDSARRWRALLVGLAFLIAFAQGFGLWHRTVHGVRLDASIAALGFTNPQSDASADRPIQRPRVSSFNDGGRTASDDGTRAVGTRDTPFDHNDVECKLLDALVLAATCASMFALFGLRFTPTVYTPPGLDRVVRVTHYAPFLSRAPPRTSTP